MENCQRLKNKVALITGAAGGIGAATAKLFAAEGATVFVTDINDLLGTKVANSIGAKASYVHLDVRSERDWQNISQLISEKFQHLDALVNNAGIIGIVQDPENISLDLWQEVHEVNLNGVILGCKYAIALMKESSGSIVNISSRSGIVGIPRAAAYASSKAAVRNHTKSVALYCAEEGYKIRCNSIHPAAILTPMWDAMLGIGKQRAIALAQIESGIPMGKMGEPIDVAYAALFLACDESKYITGIELNVDGGILAGSSASPKAK